MEYQSLIGVELADVSIDGLMEIMNFKSVELWNYPLDEKDYCLQENIPVVTVYDGEEERYFQIPKELIEMVRKAEFRGYEQGQTREHVQQKANKGEARKGKKPVET